MADNGIAEYSAAVGDAFLEDYFSKRNVSYQHKKRVEAIVTRLSDCNEGRTPTLRRSNHAGREPLTGEFAVVLEAYLERCEAHGSKASTIKAKSKFCDDFLLHIKYLGCEFVNLMKPEQVCKACLMFHNRNAWSHVRVFLGYLFENGYLGSDYSSLIPSYRRPFVMPSVYTEEEVSRLEAAIDQNSNVGIRDYAMLLLASRYGLRSGDIAILAFQNLDFERGRIRLVQEKTGQPWEAEMLPDIEAALWKYIDKVRPQSDSDTVFLRCRAPIHGIASASIGSTVARYFRIAGIVSGNRKRGTHSLRSSLASSMVNDNVPYEVVRKVLGHDDPNAIKHYAKIDVERLREYAIPVPEPVGLFARFLDGEVRI
jgi:integrase